jgi:hypothetical protein
MKCTLVYTRYLNISLADCDSLDDAIILTKGMLDDAWAYPKCLVSERGYFLLSGQQVAEMTLDIMDDYQIQEANNE